MKEDWINCNFEDILTLKNGFAFKSDKYSENGTPVIRISDINNAIVKTTNAKKVQDEENYENYLVEFGDILIAMSGATTGKFGIYKEQNKAYQNQRVGNFKLHCEELINKNYIYYLLYALRRQIEKDAYGGAQPNISSKKIEAMQITLAPLLEQKAIVAKIEQLFSELDNGVANLKTAKAKLKIYRQAVLKKAFENNTIESTLEDVAKWGSGGTPSRKNFEFFAGDIPWLKTGELGAKYIYDSEEKITEEAIKNSSAKIFPKGSVGIAMYGATIGKTSIFGNELSTNQACAVAQPYEDKITSEYLYYYLLSQKNDLINLGKGGAQPNISQGILKSYIITLPKSLKEQSQIVQEIESRLSVCDKIEETIEISLTKSEALRQSILKKAFEGKLLSEQELENIKNHLEYESAEELLIRIKKEREK